MRDRAGYGHPGSWPRSLLARRINRRAVQYATKQRAAGGALAPKRSSRVTHHCREFVTGKFRAKRRPGSVDFGFMAAKEISNHRGDAGDMNMQLALAAAA